MSIRAKILAGCLSLVLVTVAVGLLARGAQEQLGEIAFRIYDQAFMSMSYLRSAQNTLTGLARDLATGPAPDDMAERLGNALDDLDVSRARATSQSAASAADRLHGAVAGLAESAGHAEPASSLRQLRAVSDDFDRAVEIFAGDGYRARREVAALVDRTTRRMWVAMSASLAVALAITALLARAIVPSLRRAVAIASAIAAGRLDNIIAATGRSETGTLLRALATMQASIKGLMDRQESSHALEIAAQHARFEAALSNMAQGLCMIGPDRRIVVFNTKFSEMFGDPGPNPVLAAVLPSALTADGDVGRSLACSFTRPLEDGRVIAVSETPMSGGGWVATFEDVSDRHQAEARLAHMARHDVLTGLPNRLFYREHMEHVLAQVVRGGSVAVHCLDLDGFKAINESFGHAVGDGLLFALGRRLAGTVREQDLLVRLGGDEFAVVQHAPAEPHAAENLASRLLLSLADPFSIDGNLLQAGGSLGVTFVTNQAFTADELLKQASLALDRAKVEAKGSFRSFEPSMDERVQVRRQLEADLRRAVAEHQFLVYFQPLIAAQTGIVSGFEALVRWRHPARGLVPPIEFIPVAEEIGLIPTIGAWVLREACKEAATWPGQTNIAVNLSPLQFGAGSGLVDEVARALADSGLPPARLQLEITESVLMQDNDETLGVLYRIRATGVSVAMDDFGTGYSSLSYLRRFPFDKIKIDQSFIRNLAETGDCMAIVRAVVGLGHSLGMTVVAEGVETEQQSQLLRQEGCTELQGYLFSKPMPAHHAIGIIQRFQPAPMANAEQCAAEAVLS